MSVLVLFCLKFHKTASFVLFGNYWRQNWFFCIVWKLLLVLLDSLHCLRVFADKTASFVLFGNYWWQNCSFWILCIVWEILQTKPLHLFCLELIEDRTAPFGFFALSERFCRQNCFICIVWKLLKTELVLLHSLHCMRVFADRTASLVALAFNKQNDLSAHYDMCLWTGSDIIKDTTEISP